MKFSILGHALLMRERVSFIFMLPKTTPCGVDSAGREVKLCFGRRLMNIYGKNMPDCFFFISLSAFLVLPDNMDTISVPFIILLFLFYVNRKFSPYAHCEFMMKVG